MKAFFGFVLVAIAVYILEPAAATRVAQRVGDRVLPDAHAIVLEGLTRVEERLK